MAVFILLLPEIMVKPDKFLEIAGIILVAILSIFIVHLFLNSLYIATIAAPFIIAIIMFSLGFSLWLLSPLFVGVFDNFMGGIFSAFGIRLELGFLTEVLTRISQTLMGISGWLWWLIKKAREINYHALGAYLFLIALFGTISGIASMAYLSVFLVFWLIIYMKVKGDENLSDILILFKIAATIPVVIGTLGKGSTKVLLSSLLYTVGLGHGVPVDGATVFISLYKIAFGIIVLIGIWKTQTLFKMDFFCFLKESIEPVFKRTVNSSLFKFNVKEGR